MLDKLTKEVIDQCLSEFNKPINRQRVEDQILQPVILYLYDQLYNQLYERLFPYLRILAGLYLLILVLLGAIIYLLYRQNTPLRALIQ